MSLFVVPWLALSSCYPYSSDVVLCDEIPEGGCPTGRGGTCEDPLCNALYDCVNGAWKRAEVCGPPGGGGSGGSAGSGGSGAASGGEGGLDCTPAAGGAGGCTPVMLDHTGEVGGCSPGLQSPDCPAAAAESCAESACLTGCTDFFVCRAGGWEAVAYCDMDCKLTPVPR